MLKLLQKTGQLSHQSIYWKIFIGTGLIAIIVALYYQHYLQELPCVVCIQIRLWFVLLVVIACLGLVLRQSNLGRSVSNFLLVLIAIGLLERCYLLLGTERGFIFAECGFSLGLPGWLAIEDWFPWLFRIETSCGYTPEILLGITMAESLMFLSVMIFLVSFTVFILDIIATKKNL